MSIKSSVAGPSLPACFRRHASSKSNIQIHLDNHFKSKTYTSSSAVSGMVTIKTQRDVCFDSIEVVLLGYARIRTDAYHARHEAKYTFLKLVMPMPDSVYPVPRVLESSAALSIPFHFVLPESLTLSACTHRVDSDHVRGQHLRLPPSMGFGARGNWEKDDCSPDVVDIVYSIRTRVWKQSELRARPTKVMETTRAIQVVPAFDEEAPLSLTKSDRLYCMSKTIVTRTKLLSAKRGKLTVSAEQPGAIMLRPDGQISTGTAAQLHLSFEHGSGSSPPRITGISSKLRAHTFFSARPMRSPPNLGDFTKRGVSNMPATYSTSVRLPRTPLEEPTWVPFGARPDSGYQSVEIPDKTTPEEHGAKEEVRYQQHQCPSLKSRTVASFLRAAKQRRNEAGQAPAERPRCFPPSAYHIVATAQVTVDHLPTSKKFFVPTFQSCFLSRMYTLHVSVRTAGGSTLSLNLPLQIGVEAGKRPDAAQERPPDFADAIGAAAVDHPLRSPPPGVPSLADGALPDYWAT